MGGGGVTVTLLPSQQHVLIMKTSEVNCEKTGIFDDKIRDKRKRSDLEKNERQNCDLELGEFVPENSDTITTNNSDTKWKRGKKWEFNHSNSSNWGRWEYERKRNDRCFRKRDEKFEEGDKNICRSKTVELEKGEFPCKNINSQKNSSSVDCEEEPGEFKYENNNGKANWKNKYSDNAEPKNRVNYAERSHSNVHSSLKASSWNKFNHPSRHNGLHSRSSYDKQKFCDSRNQSPDKHSVEKSRHFGYRDHSRSPKDRGHHHDHRDRSPEKSPMDRNCHYDTMDRSPHYDRSPFDRGRHYNPQDHSPAYSERSPIDQSRHFDTRDHSPTYSDRSPTYRSHHYDTRDRSPTYTERSHINKTSHYDARDRSPMHYERSPVERTRHYDSRNRSPVFSERSHMSRGRNYDYRYRDRSPFDRARHLDSKEREDHRRIPAVHRDRNKKSVGNEKQHLSTSSKYGEVQRKGSTKNGLLKLPNSTLSITTTASSSIEGSGSTDVKSNKHSKNLLELNELPPPPPSSPPPPPPSEVPPPPSSPHPGSNNNGIIDNMTSMEEDMDICDTPPHDPIQVDTKPGKWHYLDYMGYEQGPLKLDNLKKLVQEGYLPSDHMVKHSDSDIWLTVENAVSPLVQLGSMPSNSADIIIPSEAQGSTLNDDGAVNIELQSDLADEDLAKNIESVVESIEELHIDKRVDALLDGYNLVNGKELDVLGEALNSKFEHAEWEKWDMTDGFSRFRAHKVGPNRHGFDTNMHEFETESQTATYLEESANANNISTDWSSIRWSCMGGDWIRIDESNHDRSLKKKIVLNHGYPLCQMPKRDNEDPRRHKREELYYQSGIRKLELPSWAFSVSEENSENSSEIDKAIISQMKPAVPRGGTIMPVVRINACVVRDYGSDAYPKSKHDRHFHRSSRSHGDRSYSVEGCSHPRIISQTDIQDLHTCRAVLNIPRDHVCTMDELSVDIGDWYYINGAGNEHGPYSYADLQEMTLKGIIMENSSVFRKVDNAWLPITLSKEEAVGPSNSFNSFHESHPQFIGYTRGKLYELVMKSFKNREFAAAINEILDPWISEKLAKKESDRHYPNLSVTKSGDKLWKSDDKYLAGKRPRYMYDGNYEATEDSFVDNSSFDDLCGEAKYISENTSINEPENENWGLLDGHVLARIFHFIKSDVKSFVSSSATCKSWNLASKFYRNLCTNVDFSSVGPSCSDSMFQNIMYGYAKDKLTSIILTGCSNITACVLEEMLRMFPSISLIDIRGCDQFYNLIPKYHEIKWVKSCSFSNSRSLEYIASGEDSSIHPFRQGVYKRAKLFDSRKSSEVMSRDAQRRRWLHRKSENGYRKMKEFITVSLKNIMKENTCEYFTRKVAQIEDKMRNGYYIRHGVSSVKDDINRMCRDAIKLKNHGSFKEMKHIVKLFMNLARSLEGNPTNESDELLKTKDSSEIYSNKKKTGKAVDKKGIKSNGHTDIFDPEIKRNLSRPKKRDMESSSESSDDHDNDFWDGDDKTEGETTESDTESDLDNRSRDNKGNTYSVMDDSFDSISDDREWGARMTKASLVPPVTRKYEVIESYLPIADEEEVKKKMRVALPDDYYEKLQAQKSGVEESDMEIPEVKEYKSRKLLGVEVLEQEVYGIDPFTHNLLLDSMPKESDWQLASKHKFIEEVLLRTLNKQVRRFTGTGNTPMVYHLRPVVEEIYKNAETDGDRRTMKLCQAIIKAMQSRPDDNYVAYRKGLGVVCNREDGFDLDDFVVEFLGEVYPAWKWFEKQDGIRSMQKNKEEPAPEFYNIYLERPKGDRDGYDLVVVDAMHKANYASRICHSCRPNCEAKVTAVDGQYQIGIYTVRPIGYGEEITFDYNSVTESKEEYEASVCLCGNHICRGSYLNLTGEDAFHKVLEESHGLLDRHKLMVDACESNYVLEEDYIDLGKAGLGTCLLSGLPDWLVAYSAHLVRFINFERTKLPEVILKHNMEEKRKFFADINIEDEKSDAEVQAEGVYNSRLQNMALTLDKVKYVMRRVFGDPKNAPPPLEKLSDPELVFMIWKGEGSLVDDLLHSMSPHMDTHIMNDLKFKIRAHDPSGSGNVIRELRKSLLWLRDELRTLPCSSKCRHDAAADLIHIYAYTNCFYKVREYKTVTSPPVYISPLDLGPKYADKMGSGFKEYCKTYGENYCLGQLIYWHSQTDADPDIRLARAKRGCLSLPDVSSFYVNHHKSVHELVYDSRTLRFIMNRMEKQPQRPWPKDRIWQFKSNQKFFGSPMLDSVLNRCPLDKEMMQWLKTRPTLYNGMWDG